MSLYDIISTFESSGAFDIALPFLLIFTVTFAVLQKIQLFGSNKKNIDVVVSLVLAFLSIRNIFLISLLNRFLPNVAMFLIIILMFLLLVGTFGGEFKGFKGYAIPIAMIVSIIAVVMSLSSDFLGGYGFIFPPLFYDIFDYQTKSILLFIVGLIVVIYLTTSESSSTNTWKQVFDDLGEKFGFKK